MTAANRLWIFGTVTVTVVLLLAGWFIGAQPLLAAAAAADTERSGIDAQNQAKSTEIAQLAVDNEKLPALEKTYDALKESIPTTAASAAFISGLDALAGSAGVRIEAITIGNAVAYTIPASAVPAADPTPAEGDAAPETTDSAPAEPVGSPAVTNPLITPDNFFGIDVSVDVVGSYDAVLQFVSGMQSGPRLFLLTKFTSTTNADDGNVTASVGGLVYVLKPAR